LARRNNPERLGAPQPDPPFIPEELTQTPQADSLSFVVPTEFVALPSEGRYYPDGHPLHGEDAVEIRYMTAKEEDLLSSRSLLEKGIVLDRLIQSVLVDTRLKSRDMLICDRNAVLIAARISGYGPDYSGRITCRECAEVETYKYDLSEIVTKACVTKKELKKHKVTQPREDLFAVTIPGSSVEITMRLLNGHHERMVTDLAEKRRKKKMGDRLVTDQLKMMIVSVLGHTDRETIDQYIHSLPLRDSRFLRNIYETISPSVELRKEVVCGECGHQDDVMFPFTTEFFWPDS
jgi:hypothetical protein